MASTYDMLSGVTWRHPDFPSGEFVTDVMTLMKLVNADTGEVSFHIDCNNDLDVITQHGLLAAGQAVMVVGWRASDE